MCIHERYNTLAIFFDILLKLDNLGQCVRSLHWIAECLQEDVPALQKHAMQDAIDDDW
jgi:hypothetical protein